MSKRDEMAEIHKVLEIAEQCRPFLVHQPSLRQGAVLVELVSSWLAGHFVGEDIEHIDRNATDERRALLLGLTVAAIRELLPNQEAYLLATKEGRRIETTKGRKPWSNP